MSLLTYDNVLAVFDKEVADMVASLTDDPRKTRQEQLEEQISSMRHQSYSALCIKLADRIANLRRGPGQRPPRASRLKHSLSLHETARARLEDLGVPKELPAWKLLETLEEIIQKHFAEGAF